MHDRSFVLIEILHKVLPLRKVKFPKVVIDCFFLSMSSVIPKIDVDRLN